MQTNYQITKSEREIMEVLWKHQGYVRTKELLDKMNLYGKDWKRQTLNALLNRLEEKKIVKRKHAYVEAALTETELLQAQAQQILDMFYAGEYVNFVAALTKNAQIDSETKLMLDNLVAHLKMNARVS